MQWTYCNSLSFWGNKCWPSNQNTLSFIDLSAQPFQCCKNIHHPNSPTDGWLIQVTCNVSADVITLKKKKKSERKSHCNCQNPWLRKFSKPVMPDGAKHSFVCKTACQQNCFPTAGSVTTTAPHTSLGQVTARRAQPCFGNHSEIWGFQDTNPKFSCQSMHYPKVCSWPWMQHMWGITIAALKTHTPLHGGYHKGISLIVQAVQDLALVLFKSHTHSWDCLPTAVYLEKDKTKQNYF